MSKKTILIVHPEGNFFNNPSLKAFVDTLLKEGWRVVITVDRRRCPANKVPALSLEAESKVIGWIREKLFDYFPFDLLCCIAAKIRIKFLARQIDLIVGVDRYGLIEAYYLSRILARPYVFFSFEIFYESETSEKFKRIEKLASANTDLWLTQDKLRAKDLMLENGLLEKNLFLLPLASRGLPNRHQGRYRDSIGIPKDRRVALMIGSVQKWTMADVIASTSINWPDDWVLLVHERYGATRRRLIESGIDVDELLRSGKLYIGHATCPFVDDMDNIYNGIDLGIAFYSPDMKSKYTGKNIVNIGSASGKISSFLRHGVPIVTNLRNKYADDLEGAGCGFVLQDPTEIPNFLEYYKLVTPNSNATSFFLDRLDYQLFERTLVRKIATLLR